MTSERKNDLNKASENSGEAYKTIFENLPFVAFTLGRNGRILEANEYTEKLIGLRAKDAIGKRFSELGLLGKKDLIKAFIEFRKNLQGKVTEKTVYSVKLKDGREILLELIGIPIRENGKVTKVLDVGSNITERKKIEEELREKEERYKFISESTRDIILILDKTGKVLFANKRAMEASGYAENEMVGKSIASFLTKDSIKTAFYVMAKEFLGQPQKKIELEIKTKSGGIRYLEIDEGSVPVREKDRTTGILVTGRDITERKKAEEKLKASEEKYKSIIETAPDGIVTADLKGIITTCNRVFADLTGYPKEELVGKHFTKLPTLKARDTLKYVKLFATLMRGKLPSEPTDIVWVRKDGTECCGEMGFSLIREDGKITGVQAVLRDVTERKKMMEELRESEERYRIQFEEALDAIFIADAETGIIVDCNRAATELVERSKSELIGHHQSILHPPEETKGQFSETFKKHPTEAQGQTLEAQVITKNGKLKHVNIKANIIEIGGKKLLQGIFRDITEREKAEEAIKKRTEDLEAFNKLSVGRELKMVELKKRISELENQLKEKSK